MLQGISAALAGVPVGMQGHGIWAGRRQIFVRFAGESETATLYSADGLAGELKRLMSKSGYHSVCLCGRNALGNVEFVAAVLEKWQPTLPIMIETDGQRPEALGKLGAKINLVQVSVDFPEPEMVLDRVMQTLAGAARLRYDHALVLSPREDTSDAEIVAAAERARMASESVSLVVHPAIAGDMGGSMDRRWASLLERLQLILGDVRIMLRLPPPAGLR